MQRRIRAAALALGLAVLWGAGPLLHNPYSHGPWRHALADCVGGGCAHETPASDAGSEAPPTGRGSDHCGICHALAIAACVEAVLPCVASAAGCDPTAVRTSPDIAARPVRLPLHDAPARGPPMTARS